MYKKMLLSDIKIRKSFVATIPKARKITKCRDHWDMYHCQDRDIVVNRNDVLIDGYIQYLVLKENNISEVEVKVQEDRKSIRDANEPYYKNHLTTYIYGMHFNKKTSSFSKEYVWRVPDEWKGWENNLLPGDVIFVETKYGKAPIVITQIKWLDKCPVETQVKKVVGRLY